MKVQTFMTLTCNPARHKNRNQAFRDLSVAVNHLMKRIRRHWKGAELEYFVVWERTKKGWPHAHLVLRAPYIPQTWLSRHWQDLTGAPIVDIRAVNDADQVMNYIAKYLSKDLTAPFNMKRYRASRGFFDQLVQEPPGPGGKVTNWKLYQGGPEEVARLLSGGSDRVREGPDGTITIFPPGHPDAPSFDSMSLHPELRTVVT